MTFQKIRTRAVSSLPKLIWLASRSDESPSAKTQDKHPHRLLLDHQAAEPWDAPMKKQVMSYFVGCPGGWLGRRISQQPRPSLS